MKTLSQITNDELRQAAAVSNSLRQVLINLGLKPNGSSYETVVHMAEEFQIDLSGCVRQVKRLTDSEFQYELDTQTKQCSACKNFVAWDKFTVHPRGRHGIQSRCNKCKNLNSKPYQRSPEQTRRAWLWHAYRMTLEDYDELLARQNGRCAICDKPRDKEYTLHVDHDHVTGRVRGLLCVGCNHGLGALGDNIKSLQKAIEYLAM